MSIYKPASYTSEEPIPNMSSLFATTPREENSILTEPKELLSFLKEAKLSASGELVVVPAGWKRLDYWKYLEVLNQYCREAEVPVIATHGLRHSTSELYQTYGASRDDRRQLFAHSSVSTTERYVHRKSESLEKVAKVIELFPSGHRIKKEVS